MRILRVLCVLAVVVCLLSVSAFAAEPVILSQPQNVYLPASVQLPVDVNFSVLASGENLSYQWQVSTNNGESWTSTSSIGNQSPNVTVTIRDNAINGQRLFRCLITDTDGSVVTEAVTVSVGAFTLGSIPQMLASVTDIGSMIFSTVVQACSCIVGNGMLLIGVSFFALGGAIAIVSRLLSRS